MRHSSPGISENARKRVEHFKDINLENFNSIETFFDLQNFDTSVMPERGPILKKLSYLGELDN